jgi:hypothetical protein
MKHAALLLQPETVADVQATLHHLAWPGLLLAAVAGAGMVFGSGTPLLAEGVVNQGSLRVLLALLALPLWLGLVLSGGAALVRGTFDRLTPRRPLQAAGLLAAATLLAALAGHGAMP